MSLGHRAVHRNFRTGLDNDNVSDLNFFNRDFLFHAVFYDEGGLGRKPHQLLNRFTRPSLGNSFKRLAKQNQRNNHPCRFIVQRFHRHKMSRPDLPGIVDAVQHGGGCTYCN
ncbi:hypothetical protein SDC9_55666 [bioreactor metagenome]|uniref:Uncharacterized protein n=1 Tax=bioreactor metagenome TaxID=1076179 RepID=A0A644WZS1_9ZZZZ